MTIYIPPDGGPTQVTPRDLTRRARRRLTHVTQHDQGNHNRCRPAWCPIVRHTTPTTRAGS